MHISERLTPRMVRLDQRVYSFYNSGKCNELLLKVNIIHYLYPQYTRVATSPHPRHNLILLAFFMFCKPYGLKVERDRWLYVLLITSEVSYRSLCSKAICISSSVSGLLMSFTCHFDWAIV